MPAGISATACTTSRPATARSCFWMTVRLNPGCWALRVVANSRARASVAMAGFQRVIGVLLSTEGGRRLGGRILRQMRESLLAWQWSDYTSKHRDRGNLLLHAIAVPMFLLSTVLLVTALVTREGVAAVFAVAGMGVSVLLQGRGHRREDEAPTPFDGGGDFVTRFFVEQWVTFPRFVLSGGWLRNFR